MGSHAGPVFRVEEETGQQVTIITSIAEVVHPSKVKQQLQSPLFRIPPEIRNHIFHFATLPDYKSSNLYSKHGLRHALDDGIAQKYHTSLLLTCRLIWLETNSLPLRQVAHHFYFISVANPDLPTDGKAATEIFEANVARQDVLWRHLTPIGQSNLRHIHYHTAVTEKTGKKGSAWADSMLERLRQGPQQSPPRLLTLTVRHSDWQRKRERHHGDFGIERTWDWSVLHAELLEWFFMRLTVFAVPTFRLELEGLASEATKLRAVMEGSKVALEVAARFGESQTPVRRHPMRLHYSVEERSWLEPTHNPGSANGSANKSANGSAGSTPYPQRETADPPGRWDTIDAVDDMKTAVPGEEVEYMAYILILKWEPATDTKPASDVVPKNRITTDGSDRPLRPPGARSEAMRRYEHLWAEQGSLLKLVDVQTSRDWDYRD